MMEVLNLIVLSMFIYGTSADTTVKAVRNSLVLKEHNELRESAYPLIGDIKLAAAAKKCTQRMLDNNESGKSHPCNPGRYNEGENIYTMFSPANLNDKYAMQTIEFIFKRAIEAWYVEYKDIDFTRKYWNAPMFFRSSPKPIGHFTQLVWRSTKRVGCAIGSSSRQTMVVCRYSPPGNRFTAPDIKNNVPIIKTSTGIQACKKPDMEGCEYLDCDGDFAAMARQECPKKCKLCY